MKHPKPMEGGHLLRHVRVSTVSLAILTTLLAWTLHADEAVRLGQDSDYRHVKMLRHTESFDDFERTDLGKLWSFQGATGGLTDQHVSGGRKALKVTFKGPEHLLRYSRTRLDRWRRGYARSLTVLGARFIFHNAFVFDVYNPSKEDVPLRVSIVRPFDFVLKPGPNTVTIPCTDIAAVVTRMTNVTASMAYSVPAEKEVTLVFDSFRLERESVGPVMAKVAKCFDFGPDDMTRPGFESVDHHTGYNRDRGFGWTEPNETDQRDALRTIISDGRDPLGDLLRDGVQNLTSPFLVDLANGKYRVLMAGGPRWGGIYQITPTDYDFMVRAEGEVCRLRLRASDQFERVRAYYGHDMTQYFFNEDIWKLFGEPMYDPVTFEVEVKDGQLELDFRSSPRIGRGYLNFMVIYPVDKANAVEQELGRLWHDIRKRFCHVSYRPLDRELAARRMSPGVHPEMLQPELRNRLLDRFIPKETPPESSRSAKPGKLLFFRRSSTEAVYPDSLPRPEDLTDKLTGVGFQGHRLALTLGMFATTELHDVEVKPLTLYGPATIRSNAVSYTHLRAHET